MSRVGANRIVPELAFPSATNYRYLEKRRRNARPVFVVSRVLSAVGCQRRTLSPGRRPVPDAPFDLPISRSAS
jgi:hypothetical protein